MKKISKKVISVIVCVLLIASSLSCVMGIFASAETPTATAGKNLLKGLIPITFTCSEVGNNHYNWQEIATYIPSDPNGAKWQFGYDLRNGQNLPLKEDYWKPFTATLTDGSTDTKQWLQSMNSGKDFIITYELADASIIEGFSVKTASATNEDKTVKVYVGSDYTELFTNLVGTYNTTEANIDGNVSFINAKYVMFVFSYNPMYVTEIELYGEKTAPNAAAGLIPVTFTGSNVGGNAYNWQESATGKDEGWAHGYDKSNGQGSASEWTERTTKLTDGNTTTSQWIQPIGGGNDFVITYELANATDIEGFVIRTSNATNASKTVKVYIGSDYTELFTNLVGTYTTEAVNIQDKITAFNAKYIMFVFSYNPLYVNEIEVYGEKTAPNAVSGLIPVTFTGSDVGGNSWNWQESATGKDEGWEHGFDKYRDLAATEAWITRTAKLTDGNIATSQWVQPLGSGKDFVITYELANATDIEGLVIKTASATNASKTVKVYIGSDYTELFKNLVGTYTTTDDNIQEAITAFNAKYVMLVFSYNPMYVTEIEVYGETAECTHENTATTDANVVEPTYFTAGSKDVVCECGETVEEDVVIPCDTANPVKFGTPVLNPTTNELKVEWEYSDALAIDLFNATTKELVVKFAFGDKEYSVKLDKVSELGEVLSIGGINADRFSKDFSVKLEFVVDDYDITALNAVAKLAAVKVSDTIDASNEKADEYAKLIEEIAKVDEAVVAGEAKDNNDFTAGASKVDIAAGKAEIKFVATQALIDELAENKAYNGTRTAKLVVTIDGKDYDVVIAKLMSSITVKISGLSFDQMYGKISVKLVVDYAGATDAVTTETVTFDFVNGINESTDAVAAALEALLG